MPDTSDVTTNRNPKQLPRTVWTLSLVSFLADVSSEMVYPLLPLFLVSVMGSSRLQLGTMEGGAALVVALMSAYAGIRSDRKRIRGGRVVWIRWGYGLPVIGKSIIAVATMWPLVIGGRLLDRFGKGLRGAPRDALIANAVTSDQRGRAFGLHRAFDTAGALTGVLLSALILWWLTGTPQQTDDLARTAVETPGWIYRIIFGIGAVLGLGSLILTFFVRESSPRESTDQEAKVPQIGTRTGLFNLSTSYWCVLCVLVLFSMANSSDTFLLLRARDLGYSPWAVVMVYAAYNMTYSILSFPVGILSDKLGRWRIIAIGWAIYAFVYAGFALLSQTQAWGLWPLMAMYGVYMALTDGVGKALISDHSPQESRGAAMGIYYALTGLTTLAASILTGLLWDRSGPTSAFLLGSGFAVVALLAVILLRRRLALDNAGIMSSNR